MSKPIRSILALGAAALLLAISGIHVTPIAAQTPAQAAAPSGPAPRFPNGRPDLTGGVDASLCRMA